MKMSKVLLAGLLSVTTLIGAQPAQANNKDVGTILGALIGGALGAEAGDGDAGAAIVGAIIGGAIGNAVGKELDYQDRRAIAEARAQALRNGGAVNWDGRHYQSRTGATGNIYISREGYHRSNQLRCREYVSEVRIRGRVERTTSQACVDRYGNWTEVTATEVIYGGRPTVGGGYSGYPSHGPVVVPSYPTPRPGAYPSRPGYQRYEVADHEVLQLVSELRRQTWDSERNSVLRMHVDFWSRRGQRLSTYRLSEILATFTYDNDRLRATQTLKPLLNIEINDVNRALRTFTFSYSREEARRTLMY